MHYGQHNIYVIWDCVAPKLGKYGSDMSKELQSSKDLIKNGLFFGNFAEHKLTCLSYFVTIL